jgi:transcriptional antiterminator RfaH
MSSEMTSSILWFLAQLKPNGFERACVNLERQEFQTFMPVREMLIRRGRSSQKSKQPLFPGYIFVGTERVNPNWSSINSTLGVSRLVSFGKNEPTPIPEQLINGLMARCGEDFSLLSPDNLKIGDQVRAVSGPFAEYIATIETISNETRLGILFDVLGQKKRAVIQVSDIEKIEK